MKRTRTVELVLVTLVLFATLATATSPFSSRIFPGVIPAHGLLTCPTAGPTDACLTVSLDPHSSSPGSAVNCATTSAQIGTTQKAVCDTAISTTATTNATTFRVGAILNATSANPATSTTNCGGLGQVSCGVFAWQFAINYNSTFLAPIGDPSAQCTSYPDCGEKDNWYGSQTNVAGLPTGWAGILNSGSGAAPAFRVTEDPATHQGEVQVGFTFLLPSTPKVVSARNVLGSVAFEILKSGTTTISMNAADTLFVDGNSIPISGIVAAPTGSCTATSCGSYTMTITNDPPHASFTTTHTGTSYTFTSTSTDSDGTIPNPAGYFWDFGDGTTDLVTTGPTVTHDYGLTGARTAPGRFTATLRVVDDLGATGAARDPAGLVLVNPQPSHNSSSLGIVELGPTPGFTVTPSIPAVGSSATFDASSSTYPDEPIITGSHPLGGTASAIDPLIMLDDLNANGVWDSGEPVVRDVDSSATYSAGDTIISGNPTIGDPLTVDGKIVFVDSNLDSMWNSPETVFYDTNHNSVYDGIVSYSWDFGDSSPLGSGMIITHSYRSSGAHQVNLTITDNLGLAASKVMTITADQPPGVSFTEDKSSVRKGEVITLTITATDQDGSVASISVDWGDGTVHALSGSATSDTHSYSTVGSFTVTVTATDNLGKTSSATSTKTVTEVPPTVSSSADKTSAETGQVITLSITSSDPDGSVTTTKVDWGDGTVDSLGAVTSATHTYTTAKSYTITITVTDNDGSTATSTVGVTINSPGTVFPLPGGLIPWVVVVVVIVALAGVALWRRRAAMTKRKQPPPR